MTMIHYVTYDADGNLDGSYIQELQPGHADRYILWPEDLPLPWYYYRANADRTGLELVPPIPVDPVPDEPVESDPPQP